MNLGELHCGAVSRYPPLENGLSDTLSALGGQGVACHHQLRLIREAPNVEPSEWGAVRVLLIAPTNLWASVAVTDQTSTERAKVEQVPAC